MSRLYPAEITAIEANIARSVKTGKEHIGERLEQLDPASARYAAQSKELMREFNALETTVTANAIQPLLTRWRREKEVGGKLVIESRVDARRTLWDVLHDAAVLPPSAMTEQVQ